MHALLHLLFYSKGKGLRVLAIFMTSLFAVMVIYNLSIYIGGFERNKAAFDILMGISFCLAAIINGLTVKGYFADRCKFLRYEGENDEYFFVKVGRWTWIFLVIGIVFIVTSIEKGYY